MKLIDRTLATLTIAGIFFVGVMLYASNKTGVSDRKEIMKAVSDRPDKYGESDHEKFVKQLKTRGIVPPTFPTSATQP